MLRFGTRIGMLIALLAVLAVGTVRAQEEDYGQSSYDHVARVDRYLDAEVWTNQPDGEYYVGDNILFHFRVSRDAFVAIYVIDTRGRVKLLFPSSPAEDNFVYGGMTYTIPGDHDDYDLIVTGPEGVENVQIIASRERFPVPPWYNNSGLVFDGDDRYDYMDYLNGRYFVRYDGQRFAYDRAAVFVEEWEEYYYRPVYYPVYPAWSVYGNVYIDYPYGGTVYINGIYWGIAPLYIPRIIVGWHTITIYDRYDYCWESDFHVNRHNTIILDRTVVKTSATAISKYRDVRLVGYRNPVQHGYPAFGTEKTALKNTVLPNGKTVRGKSVRVGDGSDAPLVKKHVRGSTTLTKGSRGLEANYGVDNNTPRSKGETRSKYNSSGKVRSGSYDKGKSDAYRSKSGAGSSRSSGESGSSKTVTPGSGKAGSDSKASGTTNPRVSNKKPANSSSGKSSSGKPTVKSSTSKKPVKKSSGKVDNGKAKSSSSKGSVKPAAKPPVKTSGRSAGAATKSSGKSSGTSARSKSKSGGRL